jgi:hypothetical protein
MWEDSVGLGDSAGGTMKHEAKTGGNKFKARWLGAVAGAAILLAPVYAQAQTDPPPLKWSDLSYVFDSQEGHNGKEALQS